MNSEALSSTQTAELFEKGDYFSVAQHGAAETWQKYAALALIAKCEQALEGLRAFNNPEAHLYRSVAHWMAGDDEAACNLLQSCPLPRASAFLALIKKPKINVLAQQSRQFPTKDPKFDVRIFGYEDKFDPAKPYQSVHRYYNPKNPPDFYACFVVEQREIPPDIQSLACPTFGVTSDYDIHIQTIMPWLQILDHLVVAGPQEWQDVSRLIKGQVSTFPKLYGVQEKLPEILPSHKREFDVFISGTVVHPYNPDKYDVLNSVFCMADVNAHIIDGFMGGDDYLKILSKTKVTFTFVRRPDEMPTRGLESLAMGVGTIVQRESVLNAYLSEEQGLFTYSSAKDLPDVIRRVLRNWDAIFPKILAGHENVRTQFNSAHTYSQYLRYLTFLASAGHKRTIQSGFREDLSCKEIFFFRGMNHPIAVRESRRLVNMGLWSDHFKKKRSARILIDMARELALETGIQFYLPAKSARGEGIFQPELVQEVKKLYEAAFNTFPESLVAKFNFIRCMLHFGEERDVLNALSLLDQSLFKPFSAYKIDLLEDVFPWDFFSQMFNYRDYFDLIVASLMNSKNVENELQSLIRASMHSYLGHYVDRAAHLQKAIQLDPKHDYYKLALAFVFLASNSKEECALAGPLFEELIDRSMYIRQAFRPFKRLVDAGIYSSSRASELIAKTERLEKSIFKSLYIEDWYPPFLKPIPGGLHLMPIEKRYL